MYQWPQNAPNLLDVICPEDLHAAPGMQQILQSFCESCLDPPKNLSTERMKMLRRQILDDSMPILRRVVNSLGILYDSKDSCHAVHIGVLLSVVAALLPLLSLEYWWELNIDGALLALVQYPPCARNALATCSAVLKSEFISPGGDRLLSFTTTCIHSTVFPQCRAFCFLVLPRITNKQR